MNNLYAMALEGRTEAEREAAEPTQRTVVIAGPLSEQFTQELARQYSKQDPVTGTAKDPDVSNVATESQAQDVTIMQNLVSNLSRTDAGGEGDGEVPESPVTIFGVDEAELSPEDVVEVTSRLASQENPRDFVVVVKSEEPTSNANAETAPVAELEPLEAEASERQAERKNTRAALESIVKKFGGTLYSSLEMFCKACEDSETGGVPDQTEETLTDNDIGADSTAPDQMADALSDPVEGSEDAPPSDTAAVIG